MAHILMAEDNPSVREAVTTVLESEFHTVVGVDDGEKALAEYANSHPALVILDIMMPVKSGLEVCREIRRTDSVTPIMFLSAKDDETNKVLGLGIGADDYLPKPFGIGELTARVNALLRRGAISGNVNLKSSLSFKVGSWIVRGGELALVKIDGNRVSLTPHELMLLRFFSLHPNQILTKEELMENVWGQKYHPFSRTLQQHICNLRKKLKGCEWFIETVVHFGFRMNTERAAGSESMV